MIKLSEQQKKIVDSAGEWLEAKGIAYLAMEMRTGKTLTALSIAERNGKKNVLFITKLKAVQSVLDDYAKLGGNFKINVINDSFQRIEKEEPIYDLFIVDEAHGYGAFPKPSRRTLALKELVGDTDLLLLSGTPSPETFGSQLYHQFVLSEHSPFGEYKNFYKWAHEFVNIKQRMINGVSVNDYTDAKKDVIVPFVKDYFFTLTQAEAGIKSDITETILRVPMLSRTAEIIRRIRTDKLVILNSGGERHEVIGDTAVKEMQKVHQICSGTVKDETGKELILDTSKAVYIRDHFAGKRIAIFYLYRAERKILDKIFPHNTESPEEFRDSPDLVFLCQIVKGSMGTDLSIADCLIFYNIHFAAVQYWQARARLSNYKRKRTCPVYWIFGEGGIEDKIYEAVINKKDYTTIFYKDYGKY